MKRVKKIALNGTWKVINNERKIETTIDIPGTVYEALINNKIIPDPFYGNNEHEVNWIHESDWIFEKSFEIKEEILSYSNILLRFYGIDLIAKIFL
ncbi:MAG: glycosyl hydrolase 2 galactose-binding domain-containing protein, partial [Promethearchaeota archaeon]